MIINIKETRLLTFHTSLQIRQLNEGFRFEALDRKYFAEKSNIIHI